LRFGNNKVNRIFIYAVAVAAGYFSLIFFLGDPGKGLLEGKLTRDVFFRRNFLISNLTSGPSPADFFQTGDAQYAGEWSLVTYSMAAFALTNIAMIEPQTAAESSRIIAKWIDFCVDKEFSNFDEAAWGEKSLDDKTLNKDYGHVGYYGHLNLMLGCYALLNNDGRFLELHKKLSDSIARRMSKYSHRHIETYPGETYPPDNTVAVASLSVADKTIGTDYKRLIEEWVEQSKKIEWLPYGLIVFQIDSITGEPVQTCRGSNIGWNSFFMPIIDEGYAKVQFDRLKKYMLRRYIGFAAFKEYPQGGWFRIDRDTGPVIFGLGGTATGFSVAGAKWSNDEELLNLLLRPFEFLGVSVTKNNQRRYIAVPVLADAIMLAMKTACRWRPLWEENN
jgi:hypothetical protein